MMDKVAAVKNVHHRLGSSPLIMWLLSLLVFVLWLAATIVQIQTSEYLAFGGVKQVTAVAWSILTQPWLLITGQAPISVATGWLYGWIVEAVTLVFALALSVAIVKISTVNPTLAKLFGLAGTILIVLNSWADYSSSPGSNPLVQFLIALAVGGMAVVGLPLAVGLAEHGFSEL
jgi:hypothetical protein